MYLWVFLMKSNCRIHRQHSLHLHPITISSKNCQFSYTTHRTLSFFMCIGVKWRGKIAETRKTCTHEYFSWKPIVWFMSNSLSRFGQSHFLWKISSFLTQHIGVWALYGYLRGSEAGKQAPHANMYIWGLLMKSNHWIHGNLSSHLRPITSSMQNCQFPYTTNRTLSNLMDIRVRLKGKFAETRQACMNESVSQMPIVVLMRNI